MKNRGRTRQASKPTTEMLKCSYIFVSSRKLHPLWAESKVHLLTVSPYWDFLPSSKMEEETAARACYYLTFDVFWPSCQNSQIPSLQPESIHWNRSHSFLNWCSCICCHLKNSSLGGNWAGAYMCVGERRISGQVKWVCMLPWLLSFVVFHHCCDSLTYLCQSPSNLVSGLAIEQNVPFFGS